jgi:hypothetical protein
MDREAIEEAIEVLEDANADMLMETGDKNYYVEAITALRQALETDLAKVGEVGVWGQCEPQPALEDGWSNWICPRPQGYLMQCCDCELIHEVDFRVVRYESESSEVYEVIDDLNLQAQMRMKRRDDLSLRREWVSLTDQEVWEAIDDVLEGGGWLDVARTLEQAFKEKNT